MKNYENPSSCFVVLLVIIHGQVIYQLERYFRNLPRGWDVPMYECMTHTHVCITVSHDSTNKHQYILDRLVCMFHGSWTRWSKRLTSKNFREIKGKSKEGAGHWPKSPCPSTTTPTKGDKSQLSLSHQAIPEARANLSFVWGGTSQPLSQNH